MIIIYVIKTESIFLYAVSEAQRPEQSLNITYL